MNARNSLNRFIVVFSLIIFFFCPLMSKDVEFSGITVADSVKRGAIGWGAGQILGIAMEEIFPGTGAATKADISRLNAKLDAIQTQLNNLKDQFERECNEIRKEVLKSEFNIGTISLAEYTRLVSNTFLNLKEELNKNGDSLNAEEKDQRVKTISYLMSIIRDRIAPNTGALHDILHGNRSEGLYKVYADLLKASSRFTTYENYHSKVVDLYEYYNHIEAVETYLAIECYNASGYSKEIKDSRVKQLETDSLAELKWIQSVKQLPVGTVLYRDRSMMFYMPSDYIHRMAMPIEKGYSLLHDQWNKEKQFGFSNWHIPTKDEVLGIFVHWTGSPWKFAVEQGFAYMSAKTCIGWTDPNLPPVVQEFYQPDPQSPVKLSHWVPHWGWFDPGSCKFFNAGINDKVNNVHIIPARSVPEEEMQKYFW